MRAAITVSKAPSELDWTDAQRQMRAVAEYLAGHEAEALVQEDGDPTTALDRKWQKVISPSDLPSAWTAQANKRVQFGYGLNYLVYLENAVIVDVEPTRPPATRFNKGNVRSNRTPQSASVAVKAFSSSGLNDPRSIVL